MTQHDISLTAARIGKGKALHHYYPEATRTSCAAGGMGDADATIVEGGVITCKTCLKSLAKDVEYYHGVAIEMDEKRTIARASQSTPSHVATDWTQVEQAHTAYVARSNGDVQAAEPVFMVWHEASGEPFLFEGTDETGDFVWLRDLTSWDAHRVGVEILKDGYTARQPEEPDADADAYDALMRETQDGELRVPKAPAEPFTWLHLRVETSDELAALTQALEYRASAPTRGAFTRAASALLKRLAATPPARNGMTRTDWCAQRVTEVYGGALVRTRACRLPLNPDGTCPAPSLHV